MAKQQMNWYSKLRVLLLLVYTSNNSADEMVYFEDILNHLTNSLEWLTTDSDGILLDLCYFVIQQITLEKAVKNTAKFINYVPVTFDIQLSSVITKYVRLYHIVFEHIINTFRREEILSNSKTKEELQKYDIKYTLLYQHFFPHLKILKYIF